MFSCWGRQFETIISSLYHEAEYVFQAVSKRQYGKSDMPDMSSSFLGKNSKIWQYFTHFRLSKLTHSVAWKSPISILGMSGYLI